MKAPEYKDLPPHVKKFYRKLNRIRPGLGKKWLTAALASRSCTLISLYSFWLEFPDNLSIGGISGHFLYSDTPEGIDYWNDLVYMWTERD